MPSKKDTYNEEMRPLVQRLYEIAETNKMSLIIDVELDKDEQSQEAASTQCVGTDCDSSPRHLAAATMLSGHEDRPFNIQVVNEDVVMLVRKGTTVIPLSVDIGEGMMMDPFNGPQRNN